MDWVNGPFPGWNIVLIWAFILFFIARDLLKLNRQERTPARFVETSLLYILGIGGFSGIVSGLLHIILGDQLAESIGWPSDNLFQWEVGFASIAIGAIGCLCFWRRDFWLPVVIARSIFALGAGLTHIVDLFGRGNYALGNAGPVLYAAFLVPMILTALMWLHKSYERGRPASVQA